MFPTTPLDSEGKKVDTKKKRGKREGGWEGGGGKRVPCFSREGKKKFFEPATPEIRAQRRYDELKAKGQEASFDEILENVKQRDYIDQNREVSPLRKAEDALLLDNTDLSIEEQKKWLFEQFNKVSK